MPRPRNPTTRLALRIIAMTLMGHLGCSGSKPKAPSTNHPVELWLPVNTAGQMELQGREIWIDVELSGYTRQELELYSDYEALQDMPSGPPAPSTGKKDSSAKQRKNTPVRSEATDSTPPQP